MNRDFTNIFVSLFLFTLLLLFSHEIKWHQWILLVKTFVDTVKTAANMCILNRTSSPWHTLLNNVDSLQGKLLYCHPPPHINAKDFQPQHSKFQKRDNCVLSLSTNNQKIKRIENVVDKNFFHQVQYIYCLVASKEKCLNSMSLRWDSVSYFWEAVYWEIECLRFGAISVFRRMCERCPRGFSLSWATNQAVDQSA